MKYVAPFVILAALCCYSFAQPAQGIPNCSTTGTTLYHLAKLLAPGCAVLTATTDTQGILGIVTAGQGTTGIPTIAQAGPSVIYFDGVATIGDYFQQSLSVAGDGTDAGATCPSTNQVLGRIVGSRSDLATNVYAVLVGSQGCGGSSSGGGGTITGVLTASGSGLMGGGGSGTLNLSLTNTCGTNQVLEWSGTAWACASLVGGGTVTSFTSGNLNPLFTTSVASGSTTPALSFTQVATTANTIFGNPSSSSGNPGFFFTTSGTGSVVALTASPVFTGTPTVPGYVTTGTTVNGHALSSNVTISASDLTTGTLPHAQLPTLLSGDIPNNAANTSGTAANLSGTPALPNGTTCTTQTAGDNSTKCATDAFVLANAGGSSGTVIAAPQYAFATYPNAGSVAAVSGASGVTTDASGDINGPAAINLTGTTSPNEFSATLNTVALVPSVSGVSSWGFDTTANGGLFYLSENGGTPYYPTTALANKLALTSAPTIASGFGTSPSIVHNNGTAAFSINVGTGGSASSGVLTLPSAPDGWACHAADVTNPTTGGGYYTKETATAATSVTLTGYNTSGSATAWTASDILAVSCFAY